jgi:hypothetical protein
MISTQFRGNIVCQHNSVSTHGYPVKFVRMSLTKYSIYNLGVTLCVKNQMNDQYCENIPMWISLSGDLAFSHQDGIYGFKFPKRFSELS